MNFQPKSSIFFFFILSGLCILISCHSASETDSVEQRNTGVELQKFCVENPPLIGVFNETTFYEGGLSGLHYIPGTDMEFYTINDRGPNFDASDHPLADGKNIKLFPFPDYTQKILKLKVEGDELIAVDVKTISTADGTPTSGLPVPGLGGEWPEVAWSDFSATNAGWDSLGIDAEGIVQDADGNFWIVEEYRPSILKTDGQTGEILKIYSPFPIPKSSIPLDEVLKKRRPNRGFEAVAVVPEGKVYAMMQSPLWNPDRSMNDHSRIVRILELDPKTGDTQFYLYEMRAAEGALRQADWKIGDMVAVNHHQFLVIEHASRNENQYFDIFLIDIQDATPIKEEGYDGKTPEELLDKDGLTSAGIVPVSKQHFINLLELGYDRSHDKPEGITILDSRTIAVVNDNDYGIDAIADKDSETWNIINNGIQSCLYIITLPEDMELDLER